MDETLPRNENYDEPVGQITAKDILSFAWQISNGMAYLSDIKVQKKIKLFINTFLVQFSLVKQKKIFKEFSFLKQFMKAFQLFVCGINNQQHGVPM